MGIISVLISILSLFFAVLGVITAWLPIIGSVFAFGSPALAILGIVLGNNAMKQARRTNDSSGAGLVGVILNTITLLPALLVAVTFGSCNAFISTTAVDLAKNGLRIDVPPGIIQPPPEPLEPPPAMPDRSPRSDEDPDSDDTTDLPPPPLQPGPTQKPHP